MDNALSVSIAVSVPVFIMIGFTLFDAARRHDLHPLRRALWMVFVVVLPVAGTFVYLWARPLEDPGHLTLRVNARTTALVELLEQRDAGRLGDREFAEAKREIFETTPQS